MTTRESFYRQLEQRVEATLPVTIPSCPSWCELPAGHEYDGWVPNGDAIQHSRTHMKTFGAASIQAVEYSTDGQVTVDEPTIYLDLPDMSGDLDVQHARDLLARLSEATDELDRVLA